MPGGALIQLVAYGMQDTYLTGSPTVTFWRSTYRHHMPFASEDIAVTANSAISWGQKAIFTIPRSGDLLHTCIFEITLPPLVPNTSEKVAWTHWIGHTILQEVEVTIGGQRIDRWLGEMLQIWLELTTPASKIDGLSYMIGERDALTTLSAATIPETKILIPLAFWFARNPGMALPLISLQFHTVTIEPTFRDFTSCYQTSNNVPLTNVVSNSFACTLWCTMIYLDVDERTKFASNSLEYLVDLIGYSGYEVITQSSYRSRLSLNHPTKELFIVVRPDANWANGANRFMDFTASGSAANNSTGNETQQYAGGDSVLDMVLQLNGNDRQIVRTADYYTLVSPLLHHTRVPVGSGIMTYCFALYPELLQPSSSLNLSRIDNATLSMSLAQPVVGSLRIYVFSLLWNVLRVRSGMAGLAFSS